MEKNKVYTAKTNRGIMLDSEDGEKLSYAKNMIRKNGFARKRDGWRVLYNFRDSYYKPHSINGIYEYRGREKSSIVVHADTSLFECSYDFETVKKIPLETGVALKNQRSSGYMYGGVLWLCGMGQLLFYDGQSVKNAYENALAYTPTTALGICDKQFDSPYTVGQSPNLISGKRINKLRGVKNDTGSHSFLLDTRVRYGKPFGLCVAIRVRTSHDIVHDLMTSYVGVDSQGKEINTVIYLEFYTESLGDGLITVSHTPLDAHGNPVTVEGVEFKCCIKDGKELFLNFEAPSYETGVDNITATFYEDAELTDELNQAQIMSEAMLGGESVMALACGTSKLFFLSEKDGAFYFPRERVITVGDYTEKICAMLPMAQSSLALYKDNSFYVLRLTDSASELFLGSKIQGSVNPFAAIRFGEECLMLNRDGVYGIKDTQSKSYVYTHLNNRSRDIQRELDAIPFEYLKNACACVHKETYYLFVNGKAYVAQPNISDTREEYDWWIFDNCPAIAAASINDSLYMGRENGDVAVFDNGHTDRQDVILSSEGMDFAFSQGEFTSVVFNYRIGVSDGDKISLGERYVLAASGEYDRESELIKIPESVVFGNDGCVDIHQGDEAILIDEQGYVVYEGELLDVRPSRCTVYCGNLGLGANSTLALYIKMDESTEYTLKKENGAMQLFLDKRRVKLYDVSIDKVILKSSFEIECEIYTPVVNIGGLRKGNLCGILINPSEDTRGIIDVGYETGLGASLKSICVGASIDFNALDFGDIGFNSRFKQAVKIKCLERNVDFVRIWVRSKEGKDFGIDSVTLIYKGDKNER